METEELRVAVSVEDRAGALSLPFSRRELADILSRMIRRDPGDGLRGVELILVDDARQARLNREFLGRRGPTNILSFPDGDGGSLSLAVPTFRRECLLYGQDEGEYLLRLLAHGLAHLRGYEHGAEMDEFCALLAGV